ncbi:MAG: hypothetical protein JNM93_07550 [Bacteriovoracaceae bacterium]|nr:hypothetical protein [Bacteriovoracaceae bacterium]
MKFTILFGLLIATAHSSFASCFLQDSTSDTVYISYRSDNLDTCRKENLYFFNGVTLCFKTIKTIITKKIPIELQNYIEESKGYKIVSTRADFVLKSAEVNNRKSKKIQYSLVFKPATKVIWEKKFPENSSSKNKVIVAESNKKVLNTIQDIKDRMTTTNDPWKLVKLNSEIDSLLTQYDASLDTSVPFKSSLELAIEGMPDCNF